MPCQCERRSGSGSGSAKVVAVAKRFMAIGGGRARGREVGDGEAAGGWVRVVRRADKRRRSSEGSLPAQTTRRRVVERDGWTTAREGGRRRFRGEVLDRNDKSRRGQDGGRPLRCFRCMGNGHYASDCREPPRCWTCHKFGHRSSVCKATGVVENQVISPLVQSCCPSEGDMVDLEWSPELEVKTQNLGRSVIVSWDGVNPSGLQGMVCLLQSKWRGIDFSSSWWLCCNRMIVRLPSKSARDFLLRQESFQMCEGVARITECTFDAGAEYHDGKKIEILLKGLPLIWRTETVVKRVVNGFGHLLSFEEIEVGQEKFPLVRAVIWIRSGSSPPSFVRVRMEGWVVKVDILPGDSGIHKSFAEALKHGNKVPSQAKGKELCIDDSPPLWGRWEVGQSSRPPLKKRVTSLELPPLEKRSVLVESAKVDSGHVNCQVRVVQSDKMVEGGCVPAKEGVVPASSSVSAGLGSSRPSKRKATPGLVCMEGNLVFHMAASTEPVKEMEQVPPSVPGFFQKARSKLSGHLSRWIPSSPSSWTRGSIVCHVKKGEQGGSADFGGKGGLLSGPTSEPSIHGSLGRGSWANYFDEAGDLRWQWNADAAAGDSEARHAMLGSPAHYSNNQTSYSPSLSRSPSGCVPHRLKFIIIGRIEMACSSSEGSCSSEGTLFSMGGFCLEDGSASVCNGSGDLPLESGCERSTGLALLSPMQSDMVQVPYEPYQGSPGCGKVSSVGVLFKDGGERGRMKSFLAYDGEVQMMEGLEEVVPASLV
ncbi:hypothetical protein QJS10_CPA03g01352 [Acorus calamus]|uniref:CCHC-type domain-containing protein n=1 Tax=Acorus calamus TaxID=4465 RepID=A0AAV9F4E5_ACOCL|nr:hypothetical protein QJS10_CPA03g01352 [Acorus calamus]